MNDGLFSRIKVYSIGASNENHGPALPKNIDDLFAKRTAVIACEKTGADYRMHLPYSGDRVGDIARDWNREYMPMVDVFNYVMRDIKNDVIKQKNIFGNNRGAAGAVIISGHGGNNFLGDENTINKISKYVDVPIMYIPPLQGVYAKHPLGRLIPSHADDAEHSIALYMGVLKQEGLRELAEKDASDAIKKWPEIMGLAGYVLSNGRKYDRLREIAPELTRMAKKFLDRSFVIANYSCGEELFKKNVAVTVKKIRKFGKDISDKF